MNWWEQPPGCERRLASASLSVVTYLGQGSFASIETIAAAVGNR